ncbi:Uncharacterised protein [Mobiluncus mulieris]|nr:Uncharacterised protein [Mobiluncus mulieris]
MSSVVSVSLASVSPDAALPAIATALAVISAFAVESEGCACFAEQSTV